MTPEDPFVDALKALCDLRGGHAVVAGEIGANDQTLYQIISGVKLPSGNPRGVGPTLRKKINAVYPNWLDRESGKSQSQATLPAGSMPANGATMARVWVVGKGQGGMPERIWTDGDYPVGITDEFAEVHSTDPHAFLVRVEGSSMYPKFEAGNYALVEPGTEPELEDCVLVRLASGETLIKRLLSRRIGYKLGSFSDPAILEYEKAQVSWIYYIAHEVPRRRIKSRH